MKKGINYIVVKVAARLTRFVEFTALRTKIQCRTVRNKVSKKLMRRIMEIGSISMAELEASMDDDVLTMVNEGGR